MVSNGPEKDFHGAGGPAGAGGFPGDEEALRRLFQGAVQDLAPSDGALDHLRRAVPARRARKRQALVGMAAAALLLGTSVPAFVHVAGSDTASRDRSVNAGHGEQVQGGTGEQSGAGETGTATGDPRGERGTGAGEDGVEDRDQPSRTASGADGDGPVGGEADLAGPVPENTPVCAADQLTVASAQAEGPDGEGVVYGAFRIANTSAGDCAIGDGTVGFLAAGSADPARIAVVEHTAGDAATGLPDAPAGENGPLLLKPSAAYEVRFAWVPGETCPVNGGNAGSPEPTEPTQEDSPSGAEGTGPAQTEPQLVTEDGTRAEGSVTVTHTPAPGGPAASVTVPDACAGTIYHTGALPAE